MEVAQSLIIVCRRARAALRRSTDGASLEGACHRRVSPFLRQTHFPTATTGQPLTTNSAWD